MPTAREALRVEMLLQLPHYAARRIEPLSSVRLGDSITEFDPDLSYDPVKLVDFVLARFDTALAESEAVLEAAVGHAAASATVSVLGGFRDYVYALHLQLRGGIAPADVLSLSQSLKDQAHTLDRAIRALAEEYPGLISGEQDVPGGSLVLPR